MQGLQLRTSNRLLQSLSEADHTLLVPHLVPVRLKFRQLLEAPRRKTKAVYFLESGFASVIAKSSDGHRQAEITIVGWEGMTAVSAILGVDRSLNETIMQTDGEGQCITLQHLRDVMERSSSVRSTLQRYAHIFAGQAAHAALANAQGKIEERLARWLLMAHDRTNGDRLLVTHELLALMLGVRRSGVTIALQHLEAKALIDTHRANITIIDRTGLQASANGLYGAPEAEFERLFASP